MRILRALFSSHVTFFLFFSLALLLLNLTPLFLHIRHAPPGRTFALVHNNAQDFFFYTALMNEGASGQWLTSDPYTTEAHRPSLIFSYFLWIGKLSALFSLPHAVTYHLLRIVFGFLFLTACYCFLLSIRSPHPRLTFLLFLFSGPFLHTISDGGKLLRVPFMHWWTGMDPIRRVAYLPHHMFGNLFLVLSFLLLIFFFSTHRLRFLLWAFVLLPFLAFVHTPSLFLILLILPLSTILFLIRRFLPSSFRLPSFSSFFPQDFSGTAPEAVSFGGNLRKYVTCRNETRFLIWFSAYWFVGILLLFFMVSQTNRGFPWSQYIAWEKTLQFPLERELIGALGILFPFALLGIVPALFSGRFSSVLLVSWSAVPFLLMPFAKPLGLSNIRLIQGVPYLPLAVLSVFGIQTLEHFASRFFSKKRKLSRFFVGFFRSAVFFLFLSFSIPTLSWSLRDQIREYWPIFGNIYLDTRLFSAFSFLTTMYPPKTVILSTFYTGNYLPAFTHTTSFVGHFGYTNNMKAKDAATQTFFRHEMAVSEARDFLHTNQIQLVFQGPEEKPIFSGRLYPSLLDVVYDTEEVTIYAMKEG